MFKLGKRSRQRLEGVHPDLVRVVERAITITKVDFSVIEGVRTIDRQRELYEAGASQTMVSKHLTGRAVDLAAYVGGQTRWDWPLYSMISTAMKTAAADEGVAIVWGGDWPRFKDGPHFELA